MLVTPEKSISLNDMQSAQVEEAKNRLLILEGEITIATNNLKVIKADTVKSIKEKTYQEDLLVDLTSKVEQKLKDLGDIQSQNNEINEEFEKYKEEISSSRLFFEKRDKDTKERENNLNLREIEHNKQVEELNRKSNELLSTQTSVVSAKDILQKAIDSIQWLK